MICQRRRHSSIIFTSLQTVTRFELSVKIFPVLTIKNIGETEVSLHSFFTSALTESFVVNCTHKPLHPRERTSISIKWEAWWAPELVWTLLKNRKIPCPYRDSNPGPPQPVAQSSDISKTLHYKVWRHASCSFNEDIARHTRVQSVSSVGQWPHDTPDC